MSSWKAHFEDHYREDHFIFGQDLCSGFFYTRLECERPEGRSKRNTVETAFLYSFLLRPNAQSCRNPRWQPSLLSQSVQWRHIAPFHYISQGALPTATPLVGADGNALYRAEVRGSQRLGRWRGELRTCEYSPGCFYLALRGAARVRTAGKRGAALSLSWGLQLLRSSGRPGSGEKENIAVQVKSPYLNVAVLSLVGTSWGEIELLSRHKGRWRGFAATRGVGLRRCDSASRAVVLSWLHISITWDAF